MFAFLFLMGMTMSMDDGAVHVELSTGEKARGTAPVFLDLPDRLRGARFLKLERSDDGAVVPAQVLPGDPPQVVWVLEAPLPAAATRRYRLSEDQAPVARAGPRRGPELEVRADDQTTTIGLAGQNVLTYHAAVAAPPPGIDPLYRRSGFIHPLTTRSGRVLTEAFPADHAHQHGLFFAWVDTNFQGRPVDFWNQAKKTGRVANVGPVETRGGAVCRDLLARLRHEDLTAPGGPATVLDEHWTVRVYDVPGVVMVDFVSEHKCAGDQALTIHKYHYGGFGLRGTSLWFDPTAKGDDPPKPDRSGEVAFQTSEGKGRAEGNHSRPRWVDLSGRIDGAFAGVAILQHPSNFRFPQPTRLHPNKPYLAFSPMFLGEFTIRPGEPYVSRHRLILHDGKADSAALDQAWDDYANPALARVVSDAAP